MCTHDLIRKACKHKRWVMRWHLNSPMECERDKHRVFRGRDKKGLPELMLVIFRYSN